MDRLTPDDQNLIDAKNGARCPDGMFELPSVHAPISDRKPASTLRRSAAESNPENGDTCRISCASSLVPMI